MERTFKFKALIIGAGLIILAVACKKATNDLPVVTTATVSGITLDKAQSGGTVTSEGGSAITKRGVCWGTIQEPTIADSKTVDGTGSGSFSSSITGLKGSTTYYVRSYATNDAGTSYGDAISFKTGDPTSVVKDFDGNVYNTVVIGKQTWMVENLRTTHYNDGSAIPNVSENLSWGILKTGAYCNYKNDTTWAAVYGRLYNFYAVDSKKLCPAGWHVPSTAEMDTLFTHLGGDSIAGKKMKEVGTMHWRSPNLGATNESGFWGLPGGFRDHAGSYNDVVYYGYWWTSHSFDVTYASYFYLGYNYYYLGNNINGKEIGYSVRCIKD